MMKQASQHVTAVALRRHHHGAFTLVELLVVISIVALLIAILLPALRQARETAIQAKCISNMKQLHLGMMLYAQDHDDFLPPVQVKGTDSIGVVNYRWWARRYIGQYIGNRQASSRGGNKSDTEIVFCPSRTGAIADNIGRTGIGFNNISGNKIEAKPTGSAPTPLAGFKWTSRTGLLADVAMSHIWSSIDQSGYFQHIPSYRHLDSCNVMFADGHGTAFRDLIEARTNKELTHRAR